MTRIVLMVRPPQLTLAAVPTQILQKLGESVPSTGRPLSSSRCHGGRGRAHRVAAGPQVPGSTCASTQLAGEGSAAVKQAFKLYMVLNPPTFCFPEHMKAMTKCKAWIQSPPQPTSCRLGAGRITLLRECGGLKASRGSPIENQRCYGP